MSIAPFVIAGLLLLAAGLVALLVASRGRSGSYKLAAGIAAGAALLCFGGRRGLVQVWADWRSRKLSCI